MQKYDACRIFIYNFITMTITFFHPGKAFLPEIGAYRDFFVKYGVTTHILSPEGADQPRIADQPRGADQPRNADVEWYFMGRGGKKKKGKVIIHEYSSCSVPPLFRVKDRIKRLINPEPDFRLFQNEYVRSQMSPGNKIPYGFRGHGCLPQTASPATSTPASPSYDLIYVGSVDSKRRLDRLFDHFISGPLREHRLLVVSRDYQALRERLGHPPNIHFKGPVAPEEIPLCIRQARYGINFMPDREPFNSQPSGKFLDYAACRIPIISTDYAWVRQFQETAGGMYFYLRPDLSNFTWEAITGFDYRQPDLTGWSWDEKIRHSGVLEFLSSRGLLAL